MMRELIFQTKNWYYYYYYNNNNTTVTWRSIICTNNRKGGLCVSYFSLLNKVLFRWIFPYEGSSLEACHWWKYMRINVDLSKKKEDNKC